MTKEERLHLWRSLSDLFLDTEPDETLYNTITRTIQKSGLSVEDAETILWHKVYPALEISYDAII